MESTNIDFSAINALLDFLVNSPVVPPPVFANKYTYNLLLIKAILVDPPQEFFEDDLLQICKFVVRNVGSIVSSFDLNKMNQYTGLKLCQQLRIFFELEENNPDVDQIFMKRPIPSPSYYPTTSRFIFINHLLENLEELMNDSDSSTFPFNYAILTVQRELRFWYSDLVEISSNPPLFLKEVIETITKLAYDIEYALDTFLVGDVPSCHFIFWLNGILEEFRLIEQSDGRNDEEEDLNGKKEMINDMLLGGDEQLNIITILGSSRNTNRAFVDELFKSPYIIDHFESRAFGHLDPLGLFLDERRREKTILLSLLEDLADGSDIPDMYYKKPTTLIYEYLKGQRFLVVIDGVQKFDDWEDKILRWFPDSHNGSRIVVITSNKEFTFTDKSKSIVQPQSPQDDKIMKALFQKLSCPSEMLEVQTRISQRCKPESRTWVAHLLQTIHKVKQWEEVAKTLGSRVFGLEGSQVNRILDLTCIFLPDHLRSCFFYVRVFSDLLGEVILVSKLIRFWIAEGFVKHMPPQRLEDTGEDYVADLVARNLLVSFKRKSLGRVKTCDLSRVVRNFLSIKVVEDNFLQIGPSDESSSSPTVLYKRRLLIRYTWDRFVMLKPSGRFVHSLFYVDSRWYRYSHEISFIFNNFKFLRILNIPNIITGDSFTEIGVLFLLRYLAVTSSVDFIPPSISKLWNLETFRFRQSKREVVKVPDCIWDMTKLRNFNISSKFSHVSFDLDPHRLENSSTIQNNLQTFSKPSLAYGDDMEKLLRRLPGIRNLFCVFLDSWDDAKKCNRFPMLRFLNHLISLKVYYNGLGKYPCEFNFPSKLKKLTLFSFKMPWNEISQLAMLNDLEVLKLRFYAFEGERWEMEDDMVFPKLKYLMLEYIHVVNWSATRNHFPNLEHLVLKNCENIVEIPQDFAYISSLRMIKVKKCTRSAENSVKLIQQQHVGPDELKISCTDNSTAS